jgi:hypothetical protein
MSGRSLRKLPIKAHAFYLQRGNVTQNEFLFALHQTIELEANNKLKKGQLHNSNNNTPGIFTSPMQTEYFESPTRGGNYFIDLPTLNKNTNNGR